MKVNDKALKAFEDKLKVQDEIINQLSEGLNQDKQLAYNSDTSNKIEVIDLKIKDL